MRSTKQTFLVLATLLALTETANGQKPFTLNFADDSKKTENKYLLYIADENYDFPESPTDSFVTKKHKFTYSLKATTPRPVIIQQVGEDGNPSRTYTRTFVVPDEKCTMTLSEGKFKTSGTAFYTQSQATVDAHSAYSVKLNKIITKYYNIKMDYPEEKRDSAAKAIIDSYNAAAAEMRAGIADYYKAHNTEEGCVLTMIQMGDDPMSTYENAAENVKNGRFKEYLSNTVESYKKMQEARAAAEAAAKAAEQKSAAGEMFTDFEAEYEGKIQKLSDYVGKGKYVLVDFWASWCGPCKAEIPNLIKIYNQYKGDKFEVLGVATWDKPKDTLKAIEQMKIPYPQIMNAQKAGSDAYGIQGIPQIILFGPDGHIIQRNLRGNEIEQVVAKYLKQ